MEISRRSFHSTLGAAALVRGAEIPAVPIGNRRELFVDTELVDAFRGSARLELARPVDAGVALRFDRPWEGAFSNYVTVIRDGARLRLFYRGEPTAGDDGNSGEVTCVAESADGLSWTRPQLDQYEVRGVRPNNVVLANDVPFSHNFSPFLDARPGVDPAERYKALAGTRKIGLFAFVSADGLHWRKLRPEPVFPASKEWRYDSQNVSFWSAHERCYLLYYRSWKRAGSGGYRWVSRSTSADFVNWSEPVEMTFGDVPPEHLYTNQTSPYFRAPHIYVGICARFMPGRQIVSTAQAAALGVDPGYYKDCSDAVLISSRGGSRYSRTFMEGFIRPGLGLANWVSRSNYPALNLVQTGPGTMSFYVCRDNGQPTAHLQRYELRLDGLASLHAGYGGGELVTKPLTFDGSKLELNFSTSAPGGVRVELQDAAGRTLPGFALEDAQEMIGDEIERACAWRGGESVAALRGQPVRLRFALKDADVFSFRFRD
jgi:hypothetical protein